MVNNRISFVLILACLVGTVNAQQNALLKTYSLKQCIDIALKENENIKTANLNIDYQRQYKKSATEMPKTSVTYTQGQFNSIYKYDNNITIGQAIPFPAVFTSHNAVAKSQIKGSEYKLEATKADLIYQVKVSYYSLLYSYAVHDLLHKEDSIYEDFARASALKYKNGGGSILEKTATETQVMEIKNQVLESEEDINSYEIQLQTLMHTNTDFNIELADLESNFLSISLDTGVVLDHPMLKYLKQQVDINRKIVSLESAKIMPDFTVGYFNQSIYGPANIFGTDYFLTTKNRLQGFMVGAAVPLWFYPQKSKIKAAQINIQFAQSDYDYNTSVMEGQYKQAVTLYLKYRNSMNFYKNSALTNSKLIIEQALKSYNTGELSYVDYLQVVSHALNIENNYLNVIHQNNLSALKIEYLLSK